MDIEGLGTMVFAPRVSVCYTNHRGVMNRREIVPIRLWYGTSRFHEGDGEQNFLLAFDFGKDDLRDFAVKDIHSWEEVPRTHLPHLMESRRSSHWPEIRRKHLALFPECAACGTAKNLEVHHALPFHLFPERELDFANLITLCETPGHNDHFLFGHCLRWDAYNPNVAADAKSARRMIEARRLD